MQRLELEPWSSHVYGSRFLANHSLYRLLHNYHHLSSMSDRVRQKLASIIVDWFHTNPSKPFLLIKFYLQSVTVHSANSVKLEECRLLGSYRRDLVITDVSEEYSAFIIRVKRIGELGKTLAVTINRRTLRSNTI
jgi:hypothetical protein